MTTYAFTAFGSNTIYTYLLVLLGPFQGFQYPGESIEKRPSSSDSWTVKGKDKPISVKPVKDKTLHPQKSYGKPKKTQQKPRIRNYNLKDDTPGR